MILFRSGHARAILNYRVNKASSSGEVAIGLIVISGLVMVLVAGGMLTQYMRTQITTPESEVQKDFTFTIPNNNNLIGEHTVDFTVTSGNDTFSSDPVTVVVTAVNAVPEVSVGEDLIVRMPLEVTLTGNVTDDGLPNIPGTVTSEWSMMSGPGIVNFGDGTALNTTGTFSAAGTYVLRLTAHDGKASGYDELSVIAEPAPPAPDLSLRADKSLMAINDAIVIDVMIADATPFANWAQYLEFDNTKLELIDQQAGDYSTFIADTRGLPTINTSGQIRAAGFNLTNSNSGAGSLGKFTFKAIGEGQTTVNTENKSSGNLFGNAITETDEYELLPDIIIGEVSVTILSENTAPTVNAGDDMEIQLPIDSVSLSADISDDGLPQPPSISVQWSKKSGPGTVLFEPTDEIITTATFSDAGVYLLSFTADDGELTASDDLTVVVLAANKAPIAANDSYPANQDEPITVNKPGVLLNDTDPDGDEITATDIVQPPNGILDLNLNGSFIYTPKTGFYGTDQAKYKAFDGDLKSEFATIEFVVEQHNESPVVFAGNDQVVNLPNVTQLNGAANDDGLPVEPGVLSLLWTKISGPGNIVFSDDTRTSTEASFSAAGIYTLRLTASDGELTAYDEMKIMINTVPVATGETYEVFRGQLLDIIKPGVLKNDTDADNDPLEAELVNNTELGILNFKTDGSFTYIYNPSDDACFIQNGQVTVATACDNPNCNVGPCKKSAPWHDSFTYFAADNKGQSETVTVNITIKVTNAPPVVNAGQDQIIAITDAASLTGLAADDGLPDPPGNTAVQWMMVSGPGVVRFGNVDQVITTAQFTAPGKYMLRLSASDNEFLAADEVEIEVNSAPLVEIAEVSENNTVILNEEMELTGLVSDDGIPENPGETLVQWSQISGPAQAAISDVLSASTIAIFNSPGEYVLRLTADDGHLSSFDEITLNVVAKYAQVVIPGQTLFNVQPGDTIEIPFEVKTNIISLGRLLITMTKDIFISVIE